MGFLDQVPRVALEFGFVVYVVVVTGVVLLERRRPTATLALVMGLVFVPVLGLLAYGLFSRRRIRRTLRARHRREIDPLAGTAELAHLDQLPDEMSAMHGGLIRLAMKSTSAPLRRAATVDLLTTADEARTAVLRAIESGVRCIHAEFYIWRDDASGRTMTAALADRARAGVTVRVLIDHVGSWGLPRRHFAPLLEAGGEVEVFGRIRIPMRIGRSRLNFRNHRKMITVDGEVGFVGGLNVGDEYFGSRAEEVGWRDLFVRMEGDAVIGLEATFLDDWLKTTGQVVDLEGQRPSGTRALDARARPSVRRFAASQLVRKALRQANPFSDPRPVSMRSHGPLTQIIPSGPDLPVAGAIAAQFSAAIAAARTRAYIATPYFIPDEPLMLILRTAALRGVDVRILVPAPTHNDSLIVAYASRSYYDELLEVGCRIFEYESGMLHAKYLIADDIAAIGSANMDVRSFHINYEITAMFYNSGVTRALAEVYTHDLGRATEVRAPARASAPLSHRLLENTARVLSPLL